MTYQTDCTLPKELTEKIAKPYIAPHQTKRGDGQPSKPARTSRPTTAKTKKAPV